MNNALGRLFASYMWIWICLRAMTTTAAAAAAKTPPPISAETPLQCIESGCGCRMSNGSEVIDLSSISNDKDKEPYFSRVRDSDDNYYSWNPCSSYNLGSTCTVKNDVAICQNLTGGTFVNIGKLATANYTYDPLDDIVEITYREKSTRSTVVLYCARGSDETIFAYSGYDERDHIYYFTLTSPHACLVKEKGSMSVGAVLLIIFFALLIVYLCVGASYKGIVDGKRGCDVIPNVKFWKSLPSAIKRGAVFTFTCGKTPVSYNDTREEENELV
ncbi:uncharacterized protein [Oscarella lobularis]|uniref:uncharacterized protein n=1 Tax=Oscarella lobularis TaxID=121494 RepID=UPI0033134D80